MGAVKGTWNDQAKLDIPCPECGHKTEALISKLQKDKSLVCGGCGKTIAIGGDLLKQLADLKKVITSFK